MAYCTKNLRWLLIGWLSLLAYLAGAQVAKPRQLTIRKAALFERLTADLDAGQLFQRYRASLKLQQVRRNRHEPAIKDSILTVSTPTDQIRLFKNRYNTLLLGATFTSTKVSFAGLKIGVTKTVFCRTLHLNPAYAVYTFTDGMEDFVQLTCTFAGDKLKSVEYRYLVNPDTID